MLAELEYLWTVWGRNLLPTSVHRLASEGCQQSSVSVLCLWGHTAFSSSIGIRFPFTSPFPGGSDSKASVYNAGELDSIPGLGRSPGKGNSYPLWPGESGLENPIDRGAWRATVHVVSRSWIQLSNWAHKMTSNVEHIFMCLLTIHLFLGEMSVQSLCPFKIVCFLKCWAVIVLYIIWILDPD